MDNFVIKQPHITEKAVRLSQSGQYIFEVEKSATKPAVKQFVEKHYKVHVVAVRMLNTAPKPRNYRGRMYHTQSIKKAIVRIKAGEKIDVMPK